MIHGRIEQEGGPEAGDMMLKLPCRDLGKLRRFGLLPIAGSLVLFVMAYSWGNGILRDLLRDFPMDWREWKTQHIFPLLFLIPSVIMIVLGLRLLWTGLTVLGNRTRTEIRIRRDRIVVVEILGGWRKKRKLTLHSPTRLLLERGLGGGDEDPAARTLPFMPKEIWSLGLVNADEDGFPLGVFYPRELLYDLGTRLSARLPNVSGLEVAEDAPPLSGPEKPELEIHLPDPPAHSRALQESVPGGVGFSVPSLGLLKGSHGIFPFGCVFSLFPTFFLFGLIFADGESGTELIFVGAFLSLFFLAGGGMMAAGLSMGTRKERIAVRNGRLRMESRSIFGEKIREWAAGELKPLQVAPTGTTVGNQALTALYVETHDGETTAWLKMLDEEEQAWIAAHLQQALNGGGTR